MPTPLNVSRLGDWTGKDDITCWNNTNVALLKGSIVTLDLLAANTGGLGSTTYTTYIASSPPNPNLSPLSNVTLHTTASAQGSICLIAVDAVAKGAMGRFKMRGKVQVLCPGSTLCGSLLAPTATTAVATLGYGGTNTGCFGVSLQNSNDVTIANSAYLLWCLVDGWSSAFGQGAIA